MNNAIRLIIQCNSTHNSSSNGLCVECVTKIISAGNALHQYSNHKQFCSILTGPGCSCGHTEDLRIARDRWMDTIGRS